MTDSPVVRVTQSIAQLLAFVGVVAWHIMWLAGVVIMVSGFAAMMVHSAGYVRLEQAARPPRPVSLPSRTPGTTTTSRSQLPEIVWRLIYMQEESGDGGPYDVPRPTLPPVVIFVGRAESAIMSGWCSWSGTGSQRS